MGKIFINAEKNGPARLLQLEREALAAIKRLNVALAHAAPDSIREAGLAQVYCLDTLGPVAPSIPVPVGKPVAPRKSQPTPREELVKIARRHGMSEEMIEKRFGPQVVAATGKPARPPRALAIDFFFEDEAPAPAGVLKPNSPSVADAEIQPFGWDSSGVPF